MEISNDTARAKIEQWREGCADLLVRFHTNQGGSILPGNISSVINDRLLLQLDRGIFSVVLAGATYTDESDTKPEYDSMTVRFPQGGHCYLRVRNEWADVVTDESGMIKIAHPNRPTIT